MRVSKFTRRHKSCRFHHGHEVRLSDDKCSSWSGMSLGLILMIVIMIGISIAIWNEFVSIPIR